MLKIGLETSVLVFIPIYSITASKVIMMNLSLGIGYFSGKGMRLTIKYVAINNVPLIYVFRLRE